MFHNPIEPYESISDMSMVTHGSSGGIFRTLSVGGLMGCLCSLIDRKRTAMPHVIEDVCHRPGFWVSVGNSR